VEKGMSEEEAKKQAPIMLEAQEMLRKWEQGDKEVVELWRTMNGWVYEGFDKTYNELGIDFDKTYYESNTYLLGKEIVVEGLEKGVFFTKEDGSVWIDLTDDGLDQKLVQRADGTSVYITQDMGTAVQRFTENKLDAHIYVVGNEQNYHFQVLKLILKKLGYEWADSIEHLSYGMVELPEGKMKSREGTVVDADELLDEMFTTAREMSKELGKLDGLSEEEANSISKMIGLGALKYYMLKVDPKKGMLFNPRESIDFNGNTGPFIQYTHARIKSVLRKAQEQNIQAVVATEVEAAQKELDLVKSLMEFPTITEQAAATLSPALIANYIYELAKEFNQFYHDFSILKEENIAIKQFRLALSAQVAEVIKKGMKLLGIDVPERM
jgi:arginyl-tRNA synthetase